MSSEDQGPEWMVALEKKMMELKEKKQLGHEFGAGSPCLKCKNGCPGLNLHFWRKICTVCKCKKEEHDIPNEGDYTRFDILFSKVAPKPKSVVLDYRHKRPPCTNNVVMRQFTNKLSPVLPKKVQFDWIPPNIPNELAAEYMEDLPPRRAPMSGTLGAKYRKQQWEKQIPIHDISFESSANIGPEEKKVFLEYIQNIRENVVGQAKIQKLCLKHFTEQSQPHESMPQSQCAEPLSKSGTNSSTNVSVPVGSTLKLPSAFFPVMAPSKLQQHSTGHDFPPPPPFDEDITGNIDATANEDENLNNVPPNPMTGAQTDNETININKPDLITSENTAEQQYISEAEGTISIDEMLNNVTLDSEAGFDSQPSDDNKPSAAKVTEDSSLDRGAAGIEPANTDLAQTHCYHMLPVDNAIGCANCRKQIPVGNVAVLTEHAGNDVAWHPSCFVCSVCKEMLVDLIYFYYDNKVYCGRHYAYKMNIPRCYACDELIFAKEYTMADGITYHLNHFCCTDCDTQLAGKNYLFHNDVIKCLNCYNTNYTKGCQACKQKILATDQGVTLRDMHWHATTDCFQCVICGTDLFGQRISVQDGSLLCSTPCIARFNALN